MSILSLRVSDKLKSLLNHQKFVDINENDAPAHAEHSKGPLESEPRVLICSSVCLPVPVTVVAVVVKCPKYRMFAKKKPDIPPRPKIPTVEQIIEDIEHSSPDDSLFQRSFASKLYETTAPLF